MSYSDQDIKKLDHLVNNWLSVDINPNSRNEILSLQRRNAYEILDKKLSHRIAFGTAGLRSAMDSGFAFINDVTVLQASQGLICYLINNNKEKRTLSIVVGYDHRYHSQRFAEITASVAISKGIKVYYLGSMENLSNESRSLACSKSGLVENENTSYIHTPLVPFAIDFYGASAGVMVTASHNPSNDNGYKVYYCNGCQIIPPHDTGISKSIEQNLNPFNQNIWNIEHNFNEGIKKNLLISSKEEITLEYIKILKKSLLTINHLSYSFVYTPMHGVGNEIFNKILELFNGYQVAVVKEQSVPDPAFSTVKFPNPEEKGALDLSIKLAEKLGYKLVLANDPDADRFSVAVKSNGKWKQLTGNEIGFLFAMYLIEQITEISEPRNLFFLNSTVSSQILKSMAKYHGFQFEETLTGFKWIGNKAIELKEKGFRVPFAYEEAIGFMFNVVNDKDGISAALVWLQLYESWFSNGDFDPIDKLNEGYRRYGWFKECNGYYLINDLEKIPLIFSSIRNSSSKLYPEKIGEYFVTEWRDLTTGFDSTTSNNIPLLPSDSNSQMITATIEDGFQNRVRFTCRSSGTEPKLKVYIEAFSENEQESIFLAQKCWNLLKTQWFKPELYGLKEVV